MALLASGDLGFLETLLAYLTPTAILAIVMVYLILKEKATRKNGNPGPKTIICPLNPPDLHEDLRKIVDKLDDVANLLNRLMGRLEDGGRRRE